ncbi:hypothetical protein LUW74_24850 [Actinomadura madurae]|uniref:hypothetical protein n=1 Tax=Actinomadura madurae TaxID=1993 RepID=UPI0020261574|nr:hypothetical protein [Actinomadura madurae]URN06225.1 hypothetical protein LUW74_24850 [Actinomadura madurae]
MSAIDPTAGNPTSRDNGGRLRPNAQPCSIENGGAPALDELIESGGAIDGGTGPPGGPRDHRRLPRQVGVVWNGRRLA